MGEALLFAADNNGYFVRKVESTAQIVVQRSLRARVLHLSHQPKMAGHPGGRKLYYSLRRDLYWPAMAIDFYANVRECVACARNRIKLRKNRKKMTIFTAISPLECVSIDILGELIRSKRKNRDLLVITDRFTKRVRTVPMKKISSTGVAKAFVHHWVFVHGPPIYLLSDNLSQFTSRLFQDVCRILDIENLFITAYHPQCNEQVERFNRTISAAVRHYLADHPKDWDLFTDAFTYAYNSEVHRVTKVALFEPVIRRPPPPLAIQAQPAIDPLATNAHTHTKWREWLSKLIGTALAERAKGQMRYKSDFDKKIRMPIPNIQPGSYVFIRKEYFNPKKDGKHKLAAIATGPYEVIEVNQDAVVIKDKDRQHERISRDRVVMAPPPRGARNSPDTCSRNPGSLPLVENLSATVRSLSSRSARKE